MKNAIWLSMLLCGLFVARDSSAVDAPAKALKSIPEILDWKMDGDMEFYKPEDDPAKLGQEAEILKEYGFASVSRQGYLKNHVRARVEIDEMLDPAAAFGLFTFSRKPESKPLERIGNAGEERPLNIVFFQNRYYVKLTSNSMSPDIQNDLRALGRIISHLLPTSFSAPAIVTLLPKENLVRESTLFVQGPLALNKKFPLGAGDPFGLSNGAEAALGRYKFTDDTATLLLISYPTPKLAKRLLEKGYEDCHARSPSEPIFYKREGPVAVIVFGARAAETVTSLLDKVSYASSVSFDPKTHPLGVGRMMMNIFVYTGVMLALTLGAGILFGIIRITAKSVLPGKIFDRPEDVEIIRLNLQNPRAKRG